MTWEDGGGSLSGFSTRLAQLSVVIKAECWKESFHISYQSSYCCCLVKVRGTRPCWWEGCCSSMCPSLLLLASSVRKGAGPPKNHCNTSVMHYCRLMILVMNELGWKIDKCAVSLFSNGQKADTWPDLKGGGCFALDCWRKIASFLEQSLNCVSWHLSRWAGHWGCQDRSAGKENRWHPLLPFLYKSNVLRATFST